jgi:hypothetical protein
MVVVAIALGDLALLVLRLARSPPLLCRDLLLVEDRLLWRGALAGTRWVQFNCDDENAPRLASRTSFHGEGRV